MTIKYIQNTFAGGIIDPTFQARTDMGLRYNSCKEAKNLLFLPSGACVNRTGTKFVVKSGSNMVYIVPFRYSLTQQYVLEFSINTIKIIKNDVLWSALESLIEEFGLFLNKNKEGTPK